MGRASALIIALAGCESSAVEYRDGAISTEDSIRFLDADLINYDVTGAYLDWDATQSAPCPIVGAKWYARYDHGRVAHTDADGLFTIKLASYQADLDVEQPTAASTCANGTYTLTAAAIVPAVIHYADGLPIMRAFTDMRRTSLYAAIGQPFDATKGQLFVNVQGTPAPVSLSSTHATAQAFDGTTWTAGTTGAHVYFPNVDIAQWTTVTVAGGATGTGSLALAPGVVTYITVITP